MFSTIQAWRAGLTATTIIRQKQNIPVIIKIIRKSAAANSADIADLRVLPIMTRSGQSIPLEQIANIRISHTPPAITRLNGQRQITLIAEVEGNPLSVIDRLKGKFAKIILPEGYSIDFTGQYKVLIKTAIEMIFVLLAATLVIFLIMTIQFGSAKEPLAILVTIPLSLVGSIVALFVTRQGLNISVAMGAVTVVGICVNNAIVLMDYVNRQLADGQSILDAMQTAVSVRLRPILMTTLTTIAGLLPTAIGIHIGSKLFQPFAITVIGGLISSTIVTLTIIPTISASLLKAKQTL
jgi:multidrug efflux pump subunit AcrB